MKLFIFTVLLFTVQIAHAVENDTDLNLVYQKAIKSLDSDFALDVKKSQRIWLKSRNDSCELFTDIRGNDTDLSNECIILENEARIKLLKIILKINS